MSTMKVGDITITPDGIQFGNAAPSRPSPPPQIPSTPEPSWLRQQIRARPWMLLPLVLLSAAAIALALGATGLAIYLSLPALMLLVPVVLLPTGAIIGLAMVISARRSAAPEVAPPSISSSVLERRAETLRPLLATGSPDMTVENLVKRSGMSEHVVVETLTALTEQGVVDEELDVETGEWFYQLITPAQPESAPMSLSERRAHLAKQSKERS